MTNAITLALIAHDRYKEYLAYFVLEHRAEFSSFNLLATRGTGTMVRKWSALKVQVLEPGGQGGDRRLGELAASHEVQAVIFFRDPHTQAPHEPDFSELLQLCDAREIPLATNAATALALLYFLLNSPDRGIVTASAWGLTPMAENVQLAG